MRAARADTVARVPLSDRAVLGVFVALVLAACAVVVVPLEQRFADDPVEKARRGEVTGLHELSMLRAGNARRAVDEVRRRSPAEVRVQSLTLRPAGASLTVVEPANGSEREFEVDPGFGVAAGEAGDASSDYGVTFRALDAGVPERMIRIVLDQLHRDAETVDYVAAAISSGGAPLQWLLYLEGGRIRDRVWRAEADGTNVRRNGT